MTYRDTRDAAVCLVLAWIFIFEFRAHGELCLVLFALDGPRQRVQQQGALEPDWKTRPNQEGDTA